MASYKCTPNTKFRKDKELLGPYVDLLATDSKPPVRQVTFKSSSGDVTHPPRRLSGKNLSAFHKKQGLSSLQDPESKREARFQSHANRRKDKRSEIIMNNRRIHPSGPTVGLVQKAQDISTTESVISNASSSSRREQLQRWKEQKAAKETTRKNQQKKVTLTQTQVPKQMGPPSAVSSKSQIIHAPPPKKLPNASTAKGFPSKPGERRVTRAMAKANVPSAQEQMQPAIVKMKNLTLASKTRKTAANEGAKLPISKGGNGRQGAQTVVARKPPPAPSEAPPVPQKPTEQTGTSVNGSSKAKKKNMSFDQVYVDFSLKLAEASKILMNESTYWTGKRELETSIPEDVISEIESLVGSVKLLMDSKLPQFAQLLYFYLSKEENPKAILPCDLEGWWDVACLQVEKVKDRFKELAKREKNDWRPVRLLVEQPAKSVKPMYTSCKPKETGLGVKPKPKAQASTGLREFLANKRRDANPVSSNEAVLEASKPVDSPAKLTDPVPNSNKEFDGGFYKISSPLRPSNASRVVRSPRVSVGQSPGAKTPGQRRTSLGNNASLVTLAVTKSMGSFSRIGAATPDSTAKGIQNVANSEDEDKLLIADGTSLRAPEPIDKPRTPFGPHARTYSECVRYSCTVPKHELISQRKDQTEVELPENKNESQGGETKGVVASTSAVDNDSDMEFRTINLFCSINKKSLHDDEKLLDPFQEKNQENSSSSTSARSHPAQVPNLQNQYASSNPRSKCTFSRSFHHFMDVVTNGDHNLKKKNANRIKARRKCDTVKFKWKKVHQYQSGSKTSPSLDSDDYNVSVACPNVLTEPISSSSRKNPGVIGDGRYKARSDARLKEAFFVNGFQANSFYAKEADSGLKDDCLNEIHGDKSSIEDSGSSQEEYWSPFSYDEMKLFDSQNQNLRMELQAVFPDWPKEFVVLTDGQFEADLSICGTSPPPQNRYVTYVKGDIYPEPLTYCEIFGAQNFMDCNPEYSPFHDPVVTLIDSLISQHKQKPKSSWPLPNFNLNYTSNFTGVAVGCTANEGARNTSETYTSSITCDQRPKQSVVGKLVQDFSLPSRSESIGSTSTVSFQKQANDNGTDNMHQCHVCNIYHTLRRKRNKCSSSSVNVSTECTYCGRFTDVTPRRCTRISVAQSASSAVQSLPENNPSRNNNIFPFENFSNISFLHESAT